MGGEIDVSSKVGQGARFWFTVRLGRSMRASEDTAAEVENTPDEATTSLDSVTAPLPATACANTELSTSDESGSTRLLLAEDNVINQRVAQHLLERMGYAVDVVSNGLEALERLANTGYAAILMDCQMPEMDGYSATREIRDGASGPADIPIIAMTANAMQGDRERCIDAGMDDYLSKPIDTELLESKLAHWVTRRSRAG